MVVDPGSSLKKEQQRLLELIWRLRGCGGLIQAIFLTHHHADHSEGAVDLALKLNVPIAAHPVTIAKLLSKNKPSFSRVAFRQIVDGEILHVDSHQSLQALHTPGHAGGHLCLFDHRRRMLVLGDMLSGIGTVLIDPIDGDMAQYITSLERLAGLDPRLLFPGHGPPITQGVSAINTLIKSRRWRQQQVLRALNEGCRTLFEISRSAYRDLPPWKTGLYVYSTLSHLFQLEMEGKIRRAQWDYAVKVDLDSRWEPMAS